MRYAWAGGALLLLLGALFAYHKIAVISARTEGYRRATAEMQHTIAEADAKARSDEQAAQKRANEVSNALQKAKSDLDALYAAARVPVVRLCRDKSASQVHVPTATAAAGRDPDPTHTDQLPGRDIGPDLIRIARQADDQTQRLIACQRFIDTHYVVVPR